MLKTLLTSTFFVLFFTQNSFSQQDPPHQLPHQYLYVSKQTGQFSMFNGADGKTTDKYEHGTVTPRVEGPISFQVNPNDMSIGPNQTKNWTGRVWPDVANCPAPGNSVWAKLIADYDVTYSRPKGVGTGGTVQSEYECGKGSIPDNDGCAYHGGHNGKHEIIEKQGSVEQPFEIFSIDCNIPRFMQCENGQITLHCDVYPGNGSGTVTWTVGGQQLQGNDIQINMPQNFNTMQVFATYTINGVSHSCMGAIAPNNLTGFSLPCCVTATSGGATPGYIPVAGIATLTWDGPCHPPVFFSPNAVNNWQIIPPIPPAVTPSATQLMWKNNTVTATSNGRSFTASTTVVGENNTWSFTPLGMNLRIFQQKIMDIINAIDKTPFKPCGPLPNNSANFAINIGVGKICCPTNPNCVTTATKIEGQLDWSYGQRCHFPVLGIPYVASLDLVFSFGVTVGCRVNSTTTCTQDAICVQPFVSASVGGGIGCTFIGGLIQGDLQLVASASATGNICFTPPPRTASLTFNVGQLKIVGSIWLVYVFNYTVEYVVFEGWSFGPYSCNF